MKHALPLFCNTVTHYFFVTHLVTIDHTIFCMLLTDNDMIDKTLSQYSLAV